MLWSHGKSLLSGQRRFQLKAVLCNVNILAIGAGFVMFCTGWGLPEPLQNTVDILAGLFSPIAMLSTGILVGSMDLRKAVSHWQTWRTALLRLVGVPIVALGLCRILSLVFRGQSAQSALLVFYMICAMPPATSVTQLSQVYGQDAQHASEVNLLSTLLCIVTVPLMVTLYQLL